MRNAGSDPKRPPAARCSPTPPTSPLRQRPQVDLITQYLEVNFDHLTDELATCLPPESPSVLRRQDAASHLRLLIRSMMAERTKGAAAAAPDAVLGAVPGLTDAEKDLLLQRIDDVLGRARTAALPATERNVVRGDDHDGPRIRVLPSMGGRRGPVTAQSGLSAAGAQTMLQALATKSLELLGADICQVYLEEDDMLRLQAEAPDKTPPGGPDRLGTEAGFAQMVRASARAIATRDLALLEGAERRWIDRGACCIAAVPVGSSGGDGAGMLVAVRVTPRPFSPEDTIEMAKLADEVALAMASADLLSRAEDLAVLKERMKLAREIHDGLAADLSAVMQMFKYHEHRRRVDPEDADRLLEQMKELVAGALQSARDILATLRPRQTAPRRLAESVRVQVENFSSTYGLAGATRILGDDSQLVAEEREAIFQVLREALTNIRKHSQCSRVNVTVDMRRRPFVLRVEDDGVGIDLGAAEEKSGSFGILGMRERAQLLGGRLVIDNGPMGGTLLEFHGPAVPLGA